MADMKSQKALKPIFYVLQHIISEGKYFNKYYIFFQLKECPHFNLKSKCPFNLIYQKTSLFFNQVVLGKLLYKGETDSTRFPGRAGIEKLEQKQIWQIIMFHFNSGETE